MPRVLITDAGDRAGLACIRCAAAGGYLVTAAAPTAKAPGLWSRRCCSRAIIADPRDALEPFIEQLSELVRRQPHHVLIPVRDETLYAISTRREQFEPYVEIGLPGHEQLKRALSKACLASEAAKAGLAGPESRICDDTEEALAAARAFGLPVLVKGIDTIAEVAGALTRFPTRLVDTEQALRDAQQEIGRCLVQRRSTGSVISFGGVATDQGLLGSVVSRYRRTFPPLAGRSAYTETIAPPAEMSERVEALVGAIGWRGMFELELLENRDGSWQAIDFNPRPWGSIALARGAGAPLTSVWCAWLLGRRPRFVTARIGMRYRNELGDGQHILWQLHRGNYRAAASAMLPRRHVVHAFTELSDPLPGAYLGAVAARGIARDLRSRARRR